ncbi:MAG TPA: hypothetical protein VK358_09820 [Longimicrobium sp.]|nr:hypothetical protein [Longimicrobium sp.]
MKLLTTRPSPGRIRASLRQPVVFDGRNLWDTNRMAELGFRYVSIGRAPVEPQLAAGVG